MKLKINLGLNLSHPTVSFLAPKTSRGSAHVARSPRIICRPEVRRRYLFPGLRGSWEGISEESTTILPILNTFKEGSGGLR